MLVKDEKCRASTKKLQKPPKSKMLARPMAVVIALAVSVAVAVAVGFIGFSATIRTRMRDFYL